VFDRLASRVLGSDASCTSPPDIALNTLGQAHLWSYGISGDSPIALVRISDPEQLPLVRQVLMAQQYWRVKGLQADVVILNEHPIEYLDETQNFLASLVQESRWAGWNHRPGGIYLLRADGMPEADRRLLAAVARVVLPGERGDLEAQLSHPAPWATSVEEISSKASLEPPAPASTPIAQPALVMENGVGGFTPDGHEYVMTLEGDRETPLPWSNVIANPELARWSARRARRLLGPRTAARIVSPRLRTTRSAIRRARRSFYGMRSLAPRGERRLVRCHATRRPGAG
jgi:Cellobiose phosphorylase